MKFFAVAVVVLCAAVAAQAADEMGSHMLGSSYGGSSYGASIPSPPCPKNYLFSCQPSLSPAPCAQPAGGYGSAGAYSQNYPVYVAPVQAPNNFAYQPYHSYQ